MNENWQQTESGECLHTMPGNSVEKPAAQDRIVGIKEEKTRKKQLLDNKKYVNT